VVTSATQAKDSSKAPVLIIGTVNRAVWKLIANRSVTSPSQLKGKVVCITRAGTADAIALTLYLKRVGLDPAHDVTVLPGGSIEGCAAAMESNRVAAGSSARPSPHCSGPRAMSCWATSRRRTSRSSSWEWP